jgi:hypothetical protein
MNALIDDTQGEGTYRRPGDGARERNVLVVALGAVIPTHLSGTNVLVVAPALNSWLRRWLSDEDGARRRAEERAASFADRLEESGVHAEVVRATAIRCLQSRMRCRHFRPTRS